MLIKQDVTKLDFSSIWCKYCFAMKNASEAEKEKVFISLSLFHSLSFPSHFLLHSLFLHLPLYHFSSRSPVPFTPFPSLFLTFFFLSVSHCFLMKSSSHWASRGPFSSALLPGDSFNVNVKFRKDNLKSCF